MPIHLVEKDIIREKKMDEFHKECVYIVLAMSNGSCSNALIEEAKRVIKKANRNSLIKI